MYVGVSHHILLFPSNCAKNYCMLLNRTLISAHEIYFLQCSRKLRQENHALFSSTKLPPYR